MNVPPGGYLPRRQSASLLATWVALLAIATFFAVYAVPHPLTPWEPLARWTILAGSALAFAVTGRRGWLAVAAVAYLVTLATTLAITTLGGLIGALLALPALYGLSLAGVAQRRVNMWATNMWVTGARPNPGERPD